MNKKAEFAGSFYPASSEDLNNLLEMYKQEQEDVKFKSKAIIVPHAGYIFSGHAAMSGFLHLEAAENIFIIAPSHHNNFNNIVLPKYTYFETPLGSVEVNNRLIKEIVDKYPCTIDDEPFNGEHAIEVELPFLQNIFYPQRQNAADFVKNLKKLGRRLKIVPMLIGKCDYRLVADIIAEYWENSAFVISSDLSHYFPQEQCRQIDNYTATIIETGKHECLVPEQACGITGIKGLVEFADNNSCSMIRTEMYNSGDINNSKERVVGYGAWFLYTGSKNDYIERFYSKYILDTVKQTIINTLEEKPALPEKVPTVFKQLGASFVTIKSNNQLRGCMGSVYPKKPLIADIIDNTQNAAFQDFRFEPVTAEEINSLDFSVSLLSEIERIDFKGEKDLLSKIYPHGIIISDRSKRAAYLPIVWEQLPDREIFLNSLKEKAGLPPTYFSGTLEAYKFSTTDILSTNYIL